MQIKQRITAPKLKGQTLSYRPFPHYAPVSKHKEMRTRLGWTISYKSLYFVHPSLELVHLFTGMRERSITTMPCVFVRDLTSEVKLFGLRVTLTPSEKFSTYIFRIFCVRKNVIISLGVFSLFQRNSRFNGMRFLACLYVGENFPPQENEVTIPFSSKHSAPLGDIWNNYSTYFRAAIAGQWNGFSGLFYLFLLWSSQVLKVFFRSNKKFLKKAFLKRE